MGEGQRKRQISHGEWGALCGARSRDTGIMTVTD